MEPVRKVRDREQVRGQVTVAGRTGRNSRPAVVKDRAREKAVVKDRAVGDAVSDKRGNFA